MCKNNGHAMLERGRDMFGLGVTLVILGSLSTILGIAAIAAFPLDYYSRISGPICAGVFVVITGVMGIMAGRNFNREGAPTGFTPAFLTLSIIGIFAAMSQASVSGTAAGVFGTCFLVDVEDDLRNIFNDGDSDMDTNTRELYCNAAVAIHYTCLALGLLEMVLCFVSSIIGCVVGCTCCNPQPGPSVVVMQQPSNLPYAQMPTTVISTNNPVYYPQAGYIQQPAGPPPAYMPPPGQQSPPYSGPAAVPPVQAPTEQAQKAQPV